MFRWMRRDGLKRAVFVVLALLLVFQGLTLLRRGESSYRNYWGGLVFVPLAIVVGALLLWTATRRSDLLNDRPKGNRVRPSRPWSGDRRRGKRSPPTGPR